jgi:hypothetical protein
MNARDARLRQGEKGKMFEFYIPMLARQKRVHASHGRAVFADHIVDGTMRLAREVHVGGVNDLVEREATFARVKPSVTADVWPAGLAAGELRVYRDNSGKVSSYLAGEGTF